MKKIVAMILLLTFAMSGCSQFSKEKEFEEVQKIDIEITDYEETDLTASATPEAEQTLAQTEEQTEAPTQAPAATPAQGSVTEPVSANLNGKVICIDPGHGKFTENRKEKLAPESSVTKNGFKEGTKGKNYIEDDAVLAVGLKLKAKLEALGAKIIMTRTDENTTMTNSERAVFANESGAFICIKLHADSTEEGGSGMTMLVPSTKYIADTEMVNISKRLGKVILKNAVKTTGARNRGTYTTSQMTGFNWSKIPVVLFEMGFMTNQKDEEKLFNEEYQDKIAEGIANGLLEYYN